MQLQISGDMALVFRLRSFAFKLLRQGALLFVVLFPIFSFAGYAGGPYVVWVNLDRSSDGKEVDRIIVDFLANKSVECDGQWKMGDSLLYMKRRPPSIDDGLVRDVFLGKKKTKMKQLDAALRSYRDAEFPHHDGLDGIIVYSRQPEMKIMSFTVRTRRVESVAVASQGNIPMKEDVEEAFCALLPPITRAS
ncbi:MULTISPECIES: hypothetical protein [unclassified Variovorax]|jgi:hypothetical protein|uniref:hypothetical protein n=2 Tax=Betaproteobacteria TaxID=28216 RepID=UPI000F7FA081|nr:MULTISPECIES: hypothetical protein [unclassified Variovorax]RSZ32701.1 hypothetical protein EJO70_29515 [Variovorax sp. 553]RSZ33063.1 hypothetical protein EJO71_29570 [Variovorax sp. 679]